eukprot:GHVT01060475.1.p1 GENE.GHVT01060475.1~~GHVT01060475.1.p1  ORF type:complete len:185 (+),score=39.83 GHVT01060475.1:2010-2564(+)
MWTGFSCQLCSTSRYLLSSSSFKSRCSSHTVIARTAAATIDSALSRARSVATAVAFCAAILTSRCRRSSAAATAHSSRRSAAAAARLSVSSCRFSPVSRVLSPPCLGADRSSRFAPLAAHASSLGTAVLAALALPLTESTGNAKSALLASFSTEDADDRRADAAGGIVITDGPGGRDTLRHRCT